MKQLAQSTWPGIGILVADEAITPFLEAIGKGASSDKGTNVRMLLDSNGTAKNTETEGQLRKIIMT
jgi:hypothetical protein